MEFKNTKEFLKKFSKEYYKYFEFLFFLFTNIILSRGIIAMYILLELFSPLMGDSSNFNTEEDWDAAFINLAIISFICWLIFILFKILIFPIIYNCKKLFPNLHNFFDKFLSDKKFMLKVLFCVILFDLVCFFMGKDMLNNKFFEFALFGGGALTSYVLFGLTFWIKSIFQKIFFIKLLAQQEKNS